MYIFSNQGQIRVNIITLVRRAESEDPGNEYVSSHALYHVMFLPEYSVITCPVLDRSDVTDVAEWDPSVSVGFKNDPASAERWGLEVPYEIKAIEKSSMKRVFNLATKTILEAASIFS